MVRPIGFVKKGEGLVPEKDALRSAALITKRGKGLHLAARMAIGCPKNLLLKMRLLSR